MNAVASPDKPCTDPVAVDDIDGCLRGKREGVGEYAPYSAWVCRVSRPTRDGTGEPVSRDQIFRRGRGQGKNIFSVQLTTRRINNNTRLIHTLLKVLIIQRYIYT